MLLIREKGGEFYDWWKNLFDGYPVERNTIEFNKVTEMWEVGFYEGPIVVSDITLVGALCNACLKFIEWYNDRLKWLLINGDVRE